MGDTPTVVGPNRTERNRTHGQKQRGGREEEATKTAARTRTTPAIEVQHWAECLAHDLNHRTRRALQGQIACRVSQDARPLSQAYTLRKRGAVFDEINALTWTLLRAQGAGTQDEADGIRRVAVDAWLQQHQVITVTQNHRV